MHPIAERRKARSWSQTHLADATELALRTIKRAEAGVAIKPESLLAICAALECSPADLTPAPEKPEAPETTGVAPPSWSLLDHLRPIVVGTVSLTATMIISFAAYAAFEQAARSYKLDRWQIYAGLAVILTCLAVGMVGAILTFPPTGWLKTRRVSLTTALALQGLWGVFPGMMLADGFNAHEIETVTPVLLGIPIMLGYVIVATAVSTAPKGILLAIAVRNERSVLIALSVATAVGMTMDSMGATYTSALIATTWLMYRKGFGMVNLIACAMVVNPLALYSLQGASAMALHTVPTAFGWTKCAVSSALSAAGVALAMLQPAGTAVQTPAATA